MDNDHRRRSTKTFNPQTGEEGLGQNGLYWKLLRSVAKHMRSLGDKRSEKVLMASLHTMFQTCFNYTVPFPEFPELREARGTSEMSVTEFKTYYDNCQRAAILMWGVSGMDEDKLPFHEQPKQ